MTDLETRLVDTLAHEADAAPDATGLAAGARLRARRRRRTRLGLTGVAALVVAVPTVLVATSGSEPEREQPAPIAIDPTPPSESFTASLPVLPEGWRFVRWRDLEVAVPGEWQDGSRSRWCAWDGSARVGRVERPDQGGPDILCSNPEQSYGVTLGHEAAASFVYPSGHVWRYDVDEESADRVDVYVPDSWLGYWYDDDRLVSVNAADRRTVELILASVASVS